MHDMYSCISLDYCQNRKLIIFFFFLYIYNKPIYFPVIDLKQIEKKFLFLLWHIMQCILCKIHNIRPFFFFCIFIKKIYNIIIIIAVLIWLLRFKHVQQLVDIVFGSHEYWCSLMQSHGLNFQYGYFTVARHAARFFYYERHRVAFVQQT